ncbi:hypothetical protein Patl1_20253 [Pistacia atlantica]|uniref:Uncharacterized protein n=1 Tax=Pistacia atlantica TaxID=434234 RepID=A0ACC1BN44_9ROSI|nr:hypothetical protein Patl1_20253 [Pistacia atlantica]
MLRLVRITHPLMVFHPKVPETIMHRHHTVNPYAPPPPPHDPYYSSAPPQGGYPYNAYDAPPAPYGQGSGGYYGEQEEKKKSKFGGMGTGLAVGAVAGVLGGLALAEGVDALEDHIVDEAAEKVEEDLGYDPDDF